MEKKIKLSGMELKIKTSGEFLSVEWDENYGIKHHLTINPTSPDRKLIVSDGLSVVFLVNGDSVIPVTGTRVKKALEVEDALYKVKELLEEAD